MKETGMKSKKWVVCFALLLAVLVTCATNQQQGQYSRESDFTVIQSDNGVIITDYIGRNRDVNIPLQIQGMPVIGIGEWAFSSKRLTSVIIPDSVIAINGAAFYDNQLINVVIGNSVTHIGESAFHDNHLTGLTIPDSVTSIGRAAFADNLLESVVIGNSVTQIDESAFQFNHLTSLTIPDSVISIGKEAFADNRLTGITFGNGVTSIGQEAFRSNHLTSITIPESITSVGDMAFARNQLTRVSIPSSLGRYGLNAFGSIYVRVTRYKTSSEIEAEKEQQAQRQAQQEIDRAERQRQSAERQREEEERIRMLPIIKEQIMNMVRLDGTYILYQSAGGLAIRFIDRYRDIEVRERFRRQGIIRYDIIEAIVVSYSNRDGYRATVTPCRIDGSNLVIAAGTFIQEGTFTPSNNRNNLLFQTQSGGTINYTFISHPPVAGKTYNNVILRGGRGDQSYTFLQSELITRNFDGSVARTGWTYEYSEGIINGFFQLPGQSKPTEPVRSFYIIGQFLVNDNMSVFIEN